MTSLGVGVEDRWDEARASGLDPLDKLVYASNLLGSDRRVTNYGGGNTSVKTIETDPVTGLPVDVLWVKGSGGDLGTATRESFASLDLHRILTIEKRLVEGGLGEDTAVGLYPLCAFGRNNVAASIDTPLHAFVPRRAVSHMHADSVIAVAASEDAERLTGQIWEGRMGYVPWKRPGLELGLQIRDALLNEPTLDGVLMGQHGFICWADDWAECYRLTIRLIRQAEEYLARHGRLAPFGQSVVPQIETRREVLLDLLPRLRGLTVHDGHRLVVSVDSDPEALEFLGSQRLDELARLGTSCPDHFLRTKIRPMVWRVGEPLEGRLEEYRSEYRQYYERCRRPDSPPMRNPNPSLVVVPGVGIVALGKTPQEARVTGEFYRNAIRVMRGAESVSRYVALAEQEAFDIEYWALEEAKLRRQPPEKELSRRVALVTGAAQGIGLATALRLAELGSAVVLVDRDSQKLESAREAVLGVCDPNSVVAVTADVSDSASLEGAMESAILAFGGVDIVVANAGVARRGTVADTAPDDYELLDGVLIRGLYQTVGSAVRWMRAQELGGSIVVVGSKNGTAAGSNAALYSSAKAFALHLVRCAAVDHAKDGIRVNAVNPDAVVAGSGIWSAEWREQTAASLGIRPDEIEEHYRKRSLLGVAVRQEDVAEAVVWLASDRRSSRTTGCVLPVDGGNREGFLR